MKFHFHNAREKNENRSIFVKVMNECTVAHFLIHCVYAHLQVCPKDSLREYEFKIHS